jgi:glucosamine--fructose-6-phosphate aminotransferase (isomerizing)
MCGIIGYIGTRPANSHTYWGLKRLEYRGYDSAGMALLDKEGLTTFKTVGKVSRLVDKLRGDLSPEKHESYKVGIAHTRWATHGAPPK